MHRVVPKMPHTKSRKVALISLYGALAYGTIFSLSFALARHGDGKLSESAYNADLVGGIETIVVTAARREQYLSDPTMTLGIVTSEDLRVYLPPRTLPESLSGLPSVHIQKTAPGHGSPYIRGFTGNRTLAVVDGIRYNNATYRDGPNEYFSLIDSFTLGHIEVLYGPGSSLYGSEAVGGTIIVQTRSSDFREHTLGLFASAEQIVRASSGDESLVSRTSFDVGAGQIWGLRLGFSAKNYGDIQAADLGDLHATGYEETGFDGRFDARLGNDWELTVQHQSLAQDDVPRTHSTIFSRSFAGTEIGKDLRRTKDHRRRLSYVKLSGRDLFGLVFDTAEITLSHQPRRESEVRIRESGTRIDQSFESEVSAFNAVFGKDGLRYQFTYGLDYSTEAVDSGRIDSDPTTGVSTVRIQGPVGDDATYEQIGAFANIILRVGSELKFDMGGRYSFVQADIGRFEDPATRQMRSFVGDWDNFSAAIRVSYRSSHAGQVWASVGQAFRAPNIADISRFGRSRSNEFEVASPRLDPETFLSFEVGYRWTASPFRVDLAMYKVQLDKFMDTLATGRMVDGLFEVHKANSARGTINGIELSCRVELDESLFLNGNLTWTHGDITRSAGPVGGGLSTGPISRIQPLTGQVALNWSNGPYRVRFALAHTEPQHRLSDGDRRDQQRIPPGGTPGYTLLRLSAGWEVSDHLDIVLSLGNMLDQAYRSHGSGANEPGRHLAASLRVNL